MRHHCKIGLMPRWEPQARDRLRDAALELFLAHGFDNVTVAQITERAGLTRRTFSRYFTDKRDVLFAGSEQLPAAGPALSRAASARGADQPDRASLADRIRETAAELAANMQPAAPPSGHR